MSGSGHTGKETNSVAETVARIARNEAEAQWGEITGEVISFDPVRQTAEIQPDYRPNLNGQPTDMPVLYDVPVRFPRMGGFIITFPVREGNKVSLRPIWRSTESFHAGGKFEAPDEARVNSLSDMEAHLAGGEPLTSAITDFNTENLEIRSEDGSFAITFTEDGKFSMTGAAGDWFVILAELCRIVATTQTIVTRGSSGGNYAHTQQGAALALADRLDRMRVT